MAFAAGCSNSVDSAKIALTGISVTPSAVNIAVNSSLQLEALPEPADADPAEQPFVFSIANPAVASVSESGLITGKEAGATSVTVSGRISSKIAKSIPVTVTATPVPLTGIIVEPSSLNLQVGDERKVVATPVPENATDAAFSWMSSAPDVAMVSISGNVSARKAGTAVITVSAGDISTTIPVSVVEPFTVTVGSKKYVGDTLQTGVIADGIKWYQIQLPDFVNNVSGATAVAGKGLVFTAAEVDLSNSDNRLEVVPASQATLGNVENPLQMYNRKKSEYAPTGWTPAAVTNADFFLMGDYTSGYGYIGNRPCGAEVANGMVVQTAMSGRTPSFFVRDDKASGYGNVTFSGTVDAGGKTMALAEVNGYAGEGELTLFNTLGNSYPTDSAFAWSPYTSDMVRLSFPAGGWRTNDRMEFTVTKIEKNIVTAIPAKIPSGGLDFDGDGAILVGNGASEFGFGTNPEGPHAMTAVNKGDYWELNTIGDDPYVYTTLLPTGLQTATTAVFTFEYQSATGITDAQVFYGNPGAAANVSTNANLIFDNTGIDAGDESRWKTFTLDLKPALTNSTWSWGTSNATLRLDVGSSAGNHLLVRRMEVKTTGFTPPTDSRTFLSGLNVGDKVNITMNVKLNGAAITDKYINVVGCQPDGSGVILSNGTPVEIWAEAHPRTAVGWSQDGKRAWLIVVDGRQENYSVGATCLQVGAILKALGAYNAVNLDGGGSSAIAVNGEIKNRPSNTNYALRNVANGVMITTKIK
ncbi:MAG: phosphodiester glycosidase family protein [Bacteroidales bacterium]|nr:phosphodiester glycosidase family protein [Bacteroidales bacterium]